MKPSEGQILEIPCATAPWYFQDLSKTSGNTDWSPAKPASQGSSVQLITAAFLLPVGAFRGTVPCEEQL